jgi:NNP family nitrate/nitrite transporter-like MFS transporter
VLINMAFRQSFLTAKTGDPAFWGFIAFYVLCIAVTYVVYLRPAPSDVLHPRTAYAGV